MLNGTIIKNTGFLCACRSDCRSARCFPFYYAIITSFKSGSALFTVEYLADFVLS